MRKQITILSIPIDVVTMTEAVARVFQMMNEPGLHLVATANAEMLMMAYENKRVADILKTAALVVPDGAGALWAAEQQNKSFPERVTGADLAERLMERAAKEETPVYCLGSAPGVVEKAVQTLEKKFGPIHLVGCHSGFFDENEEKKIVETIQQGGAKLVLVALGVPKQEEWILNTLSHLNGVVAMGIGGTFDVLAGNISRAPEWMQRNRLEWLYRLYKQPSRVTRMMALPKFIWTVKNNKGD